MSTEENYSINGAVKLTGYTAPTIRKRLDALKSAGAKLDDGVWRIPLSALHKVGLMAKVEGGTVSSKAPDDEVETLRAKITELEKALAVSEAIAIERNESAKRLDKAMLMIEGRAPRKRWGLFS